MAELPPVPAEPAPEQRRRVRDVIPRWLAITFILVLVLGIAGSVIRLPYYAIGPGTTKDVLSLIDIPDGTATYASKGKLLITTAAPSARTLTVWEYVVVWLHPTLSAIDAHVLVPEGVTDEQQEAVNFADIENSKTDAELAAFRLLGLKTSSRKATRVLAVVRGGPADGVLEQGDVIESVGGTRVRSPEEGLEAIGRHAAGETPAIRIRRGGKAKTVRVKLRAEPGQPPRIGVILGGVFALPFDVQIDTQRIGGPSGGLVFALSLVDLLTKEDLTRGRIVAVTGTIDRDGNVGKVGGVHEKSRAAARDGATVFIVPDGEVADFRKVAPDSLRVIGVSTLAEAIAALRSLQPAA